MQYYALTQAGQDYTTAVKTLCNRMELAAEFCLPEYAVDDREYLADALALGIYNRVFPGPATRNYRELLDTLAATKEHHTAAMHLSRFLLTHQLLPGIIEDFTELFLTEAARHLSPFLALTSGGVLQSKDADNKCRYPLPFYLLNMTAAELLNRAGETRFRASRKKLVIAPACMAAPATGTCYSIQGSAGRLCTGCTASCPLSRLNSLCRNAGAELRFVRHSGEVFSSRMAHDLARTGYGVLGIACATSLLEGGWKALDAGLPVQCVPLDNPACRQWFPQPRRTSCSLPAVASLLGTTIPVREPERCYA